MVFFDFHIQHPVLIKRSFAKTVIAGETSITVRPLVLDTVSVSDTLEMYLYRHIDTFFIENVLVYQYILCCRYFSDTISLLFDQNIQ